MIVLIAILFLLATRCRHGHEGLSALRGWSYAHRGLHGNGVPENSMDAFRRALEAGYGVELDVHLLSDGGLAVIHDAALVRTTGAEGVVEDLTTQQLSDYRLEGTDQRIPTFEEVLNLFAGKVPLIIELKCERNNYAALCDAVCRAMDGYKGAYCMESFDPRCIRWLYKNRPDIIRGQLSENYFACTKAKLPGLLKFILGNHLMNFLTVPDFVAYRFKDRKSVSNFVVEKIWRAQSVTWTLRNMDEHKIAVEENRIPIFEYYMP